MRGFTSSFILRGVWTELTLTTKNLMLDVFVIAEYTSPDPIAANNAEIILLRDKLESEGRA